jgi:hypothetical protein
MHTLYNLGAGNRRLFDILPDMSAFVGWQEIRVDINAACRPDIVTSLIDMRAVIADGAASLIYCSHVLEHFFDHEVEAVLKEFTRILHPEGAAVLRQPDLSLAIRSFDETDLERTLYQSPSGPIALLDVLYGHRQSIAAGDIYMAHRTGFTEASLAGRMLQSGFDEVRTVPGVSIEFCAVGTLQTTPFQPQIDSLLYLLNP